MAIKTASIGNTGVNPGPPTYTYAGFALQIIVMGCTSKIGLDRGSRELIHERHAHQVQL